MRESLVFFDFDYIYGYATTAGGWQPGTTDPTQETIPSRPYTTGSIPSGHSCLYSYYTIPISNHYHL